jgi:hypothetical protein
MKEWRNSYSVVDLDDRFLQYAYIHSANWCEDWVLWLEVSWLHNLAPLPAPPPPKEPPVLIAKEAGWGPEPL